MSDSDIVLLNAALKRRITAELERAYPNEGGGFLLGTRENGTVIIHDVVAVQNAFASEEQYHRYAMTPLDWARLEDEAERRGLELVGYFHSHPNAPAIPSLFDRDHALPNFTYLITSVDDRAAHELRAWRLRIDRSQFDELPLLIEQHTPTEEKKL